MSSDLKSWCDNLRDLVTFVESRYDNDDYLPAFTLNLFANDAERFAERARTLGASTKKENGGYYFLQKDFGEHAIALNILRDKICERVQTGTKTVLKPAPDTPLIEVEEPVYEWKCPDSVLKDSNE